MDWLFSIQQFYFFISRSPGEHSDRKHSPSFWFALSCVEILSLLCKGQRDYCSDCWGAGQNGMRSVGYNHNSSW